MSNPNSAKAAVEFLHNHLLTHLGVEKDSRRSLGCNYPMLTKNGVKPGRIGSCGDSTLLADRNGGLIFSAISTEDLPVRLPDNIQIIQKVPESFGMYATIAEWICSPKRVFPLVAITKGKKSIAPYLSVAPETIFWSMPNALRFYMAFNAEKVKRYQSDILDFPAAAEKNNWLRISDARLALQSVSHSTPDHEWNDLLQRANEASEIIPDEIDLPFNYQDEHAVLRMLFGAKPAMGLDCI